MSGFDSDDISRELEATTRNDGPREAKEVLVRGLTILVHPDARRVGERVALPELVSGDRVYLSRLTPDFAPPCGGRSRPLADVHLSRKPLLLLERRLERAARLLDQPELKVREIAFAVGFRSASHFSRRFRELCVLTPSAYRRRT